MPLKINGNTQDPLNVGVWAERIIFYLSIFPDASIFEKVRYVQFNVPKRIWRSFSTLQTETVAQAKAQGIEKLIEKISASLVDTIDESYCYSTLESIRQTMPFMKYVELFYMTSKWLARYTTLYDPEVARIFIDGLGNPAARLHLHVASVSMEGDDQVRRIILLALRFLQASITMYPIHKAGGNKRKPHRPQDNRRARDGSCNTPYRKNKNRGDLPRSDHGHSQYNKRLDDCRPSVQWRRT